MSSGSAAIPQLKAAPQADQIAERLEGGPWRGLELALMPADVADDGALARAVEAVRGAAEGGGLALTAEAPVSWPSGAFVRVDRLTDEARACIERSADFAASIGSPVLTIHLYAPLEPDEFRTAPPLDEQAVQGFLEFFAAACVDRRVVPLIENVPPVLRMRIGGVFLSQVGGHWRDLRRWHARVPELRFTFDTSHAGLFRSFAAAYPTLFGLESDEELELARYIEELAPSLEVAHVSDAHGLLGEGLPLGDGELDLDPVIRRLGELCRYVVAEVNEPDPARSPAMKAGYRRIERALAEPAAPLARAPRRLPLETLDWSRVLERRDPVPALLELQERFGGRRVLLTGGAGSIGRALTTFLLGFRPEEVTILDANEAALTADRRARDGGVRHVLCDVRDPGRIERELAAARPDVVFHLAAYKHVDWAERFPEEFVDTNLMGSWNLLRAAGARRRGHGRRGLDRQGRGRRGRLRADEAADGAADRVLGARDRRPAHRRPLRQRPRHRGIRLRALPPPDARRPAAHGHGRRHGALLDHDGARGRRSPRTPRCSRPRGRCSRPPPSPRP